MRANMTIQNYSKIDSMWDVLVTSTSEVEDMQRFTQAEKDFVIEFLASTLEGLTCINTESRANGDGFMRMCDATEVLQHLAMLYEKFEEDEGDWQKSGVTANWTFTLEDARTALLSYDTEYRDCIGEQFDEACFEKWRSELMNKDVNEQVEHWLSLSLRISES
tara:strand:- start:750 stop:1238 length:489 start_codon:yes stop_codon:yes gene_type:complete